MDESETMGGTRGAGKRARAALLFEGDQDISPHSTHARRAQNSGLPLPLGQVWRGRMVCSSFFYFSLSHILSL